MELLSSPWVIALFTLFIGVGIGIFIHRSTFSDNSQSEKLKGELQSLEEEFDGYKASVSEHFDKTSELVQGLTENYVKVYQHLAQGSQALANTEQMSLQLGKDEQDLAAVINQIEDASADSTSTTGMEAEAPRDYAPKPVDDGVEGTLSEAFSIKKYKPEHAEEELLEAVAPTQKLA